MKKSIKHIALVVGATATLLLLGSAASDTTYKLGKSVEVLVSMLRGINLFYVDEVESDKLLEAAAHGMTRILDPYTTYLPAESMDDFTRMTTGKYGGVGSLIRQRGEWVEFTAPYKGSPADNAGIRPGDCIVKIDGKSAKGMTTQQVSSLLKGDPGSSVKLTVRKFPTDEDVDLKIKRDRIAIPGVPYYGMVADSIGYITHTDFTEGCSADLLAAYKALDSLGMKGLVLDYRSNSGGILQEAVKILSIFLPKGTEVVSTRSPKNAANNKAYKTENTPLSLDLPIVVLTNSGTASAAEIVAGALQDTDRAVLIGQRTFGKGLVQSTLPLGYNAYAKITTAKYYLPSGRCVQAIDYAHRNDDGSVASVPDSLITEFKTAAGRKVYDGGGVMPDVVLDPQYVSSFAYVVYGMGHVDDFVNDYCKQHYNELRVVPGEYHFDEGAYEEFVAWMDGKEVAWESDAQRHWKRFKEAAEKERWNEDMAAQMEAIEQNISNDTKENLYLYKKELSEIIEDNIVGRYCYNEGGIQHSLKDDSELRSAIELLEQPERYRTIVSSQDTARK